MTEIWSKPKQSSKEDRKPKPITVVCTCTTPVSQVTYAVLGHLQHSGVSQTWLEPNEPYSIRKGGYPHLCFNLLLLLRLGAQPSQTLNTLCSFCTCTTAEEWLILATFLLAFWFILVRLSAYSLSALALWKMWPRRLSKASSSSSCFLVIAS